MSERVFAQAALTPKLGGLGLRKSVEHAGFAYSASWHESKKQSGESWARPVFVSESHTAQDDASLLFDEQMHKHLVDTAPDEREKQRLLRVAQPHAGAFITAVPSNEDGNDTLLKPRVFRTAVLYRLGLPVLNQPKPCPLCMQTINVYGDHATCCAKKGDLVIRHNAIRNLVNAIACDGVLNPQMEKKGILGPTSGRRPGDVSIPDWSGSPLAIDVAVTSPIIKASVRVNSPCEEYAANQKHRKYDASFEGSNYSFCAMVFETFGAVNQEGEEVLRQLFRYAAKHLGREFSSYCVRAWARLSCTLQRSVAQAILNRIDGTEPEPEPEGVAVPESVAAVSEPSVSEEAKQVSQVGPHEEKIGERQISEKEIKEVKTGGGGEKEEKKDVVVVAAAGVSSSSGSNEMIPCVVRGGWAAAALNNSRTKHKQLSPPSRCSSGSVLSSSVVSVFGDCPCARFSSSSSSSPHNTVSHYTLHDNTIHSAEGLCGTTDDLPRERRAGPL